MRFKAKTYLFAFQILTVILLSVSCKGKIDEDSAGAYPSVYSIKLDKDVSEYNELKKFGFLI